RHGSLFSFGGESAVGHGLIEPFADLRLRRGQLLRQHVLDNCSVACKQRGVGDSPPHRPRPNHRNRPDLHSLFADFPASYLSPNIRAAFPYKIFLFASAPIGNARNPSIPDLMSLIPKPGQSVPNSTLSAISSSR